MSNEVDQEVKVSVKTEELGTGYRLTITTSHKEMHEYLTVTVIEELKRLEEEWGREEV